MPFGLFEYLFTPFGLSNSAQTFQRMMERTTDGLEGVFAYMDDSLVGSPYRQTHLRHLEAFFTSLANNGPQMRFCSPLSRDSWTHDFGNRSGPQADHAAEIKKLPTPSGYQTAAMFSWHGKLLLPFFAQLCSSFETVAQKRSVCWVAHPSNWLVTFPPAFSAQLFP